MNNIFENSYYGKPYKTRGGRRALYHHKRKDEHILILESKLCAFIYDDNGYYKGYNSSTLDIVSEWSEPIVVKCEWQEYYDYRIMMSNGEGHVRVSFFDDETIISDLYVAEEHRRKGYATILLDKVDELLNGKKATIYPLEEWKREWYEKRGYVIGKN